MNSPISAIESMIMTKTIANQKARIGMTMAIAIAIAITSINKQMLGNA